MQKIIFVQITLLILMVSFSRLNSFYMLSSKSIQQRFTVKRYLNRIIFDETDQITYNQDDSNILVRLKADDYRAIHINNILKLKFGDSIRCGIVNIGMTNNAIIMDPSLTMNSLNKIDNSNPDAILTNITTKDILINLGKRSQLYLNKKPQVDIILALPRPQKLERLLPIMSCLGVGRIILIQAKKVVKDYFGCHLLRNPKEMKKLLIEGLSQAEVDCILPQVYVKRNLRELINSELSEIINEESSIQVIAHPPLVEISSNTLISNNIENKEDLIERNKSIRFSKYISNCIKESISSGTDIPKHIVIAVGPEGGWEREEVVLFQNKNFQLVNLGDRILRTDIAVPVLLGIAHECIDHNPVN